MSDGTWHALYASEAQSLWALVAAPALFLAWLAARGRARTARDPHPSSRFVLVWSAAFAVQTILDPVATGPLARALALGPAAGTALMLLFVLLGDWRVWLLVAALLAGPGRLRTAFAASALLTPVVPVLAYAADALLRWRWPELPGQALWLVYETGFAALALWVRQRGLPRLERLDRAAQLAPADARAVACVRAVLTFAIAYYLLWATADVLILAGHDAGWALRVLPNQLYYALFVPFAFWAWFAGARTTATPTPGRIG